MADVTHAPLVYYVTSGGLIKIGTTTQFPRRMRSLKVEEVLAVEPGSYALELSRQHQFPDLQVDRGRIGPPNEWFRPGKSLLALIEDLRRTYGLPNYQGVLDCDLDPHMRRMLAMVPPLVITPVPWPGTLERFVEEITVDRASGCWRRTPQAGRKGYGRFSLDGRRYESHVASHMMFAGPIPDGFVIDHLCHDPAACQLGPTCPHRSCVNPDHLEPVLPRINMMRGGAIPAANLRKTHCSRGHKYTPENTYTAPGGNGRACKICMLAWSLARSDGRKQGAYNAAKTHCKWGHPYDEENTRRTATGRQCKTCARASLNRSRQRKRDREAALLS